MQVNSLNGVSASESELKILSTYLFTIWNINIGVIIRPDFPGQVLFLGLYLGVRAGFQKLAVCPVFAPIHKYAWTLWPYVRQYVYSMYLFYAYWLPSNKWRQLPVAILLVLRECWTEYLQTSVRMLKQQFVYRRDEGQVTCFRD